jgi:hypothetical protein
VAFCIALLGAGLSQAGAQEAPSIEDGPAQVAKPPVDPAPVSETPTAAPQPQEPSLPVAPYDEAIFQQTIPSDQLAFLTQFAGAPSNDLYRDKQFHRILHTVVPGWMYHYGRDMPIQDALDRAIEGSAVPVEVREGRYVTVAGDMGPYLMGRGFVWIDIQEGIALGGFFFHPTNGEPTPTLTVFSKQVREDSLELSQLPPAFAEDLRRWSSESGVPLLTTRYFIGGFNERILLEHDENFCDYLPGVQGPPDDDCEQRNADAADLDMNTAYYLDQVHYATNATAWMIVGHDETAFIALRDNTCGAGPNPLACHIRMTREHTRRIVLRGPKG